MTAVFVITFVVLLLALAAFIYWRTLCSMHTEQLRTQEVYVVSTPDLWKLRVCRYRRGRTVGEPVLLVHGAGANHHNFTYPPGNSLADYLAEKGYDCWAVDLRGCRSSTPPFGKTRFDVRFDDYLELDLPAVVEHIRRTTGYGRLHWVGHSMGGMLLYAYAQAHGEDRLASAVTLGAPVGFEGTNLPVSEPLLNFLRRFPLAGNIIARGGMPLLMALRRPGPFFPVNLDNVHPSLTAGNFFVMMDNVQPSVMGELLHAARTKEWRMRYGTLDVAKGLEQLRVPLLAFYAPRDPFVSVDSARRFIDRLPHGDKRWILLSRDEGCMHDYDHIEMPFSRNCRGEVFEPIGAWLAAHPARPAEPDDSAEAGGPPPRPRREDILSGSSFEHLVNRGQEQAATPEPAGASEADAAPPERELPGGHGNFGIVCPDFEDPGEGNPPRPDTGSEDTETRRGDADF